MYAVIPTGILWALSAPAHSHVRTGAPQPDSLTAVYLTPLTAGTRPQPSALADGRPLVTPSTPQDATISQTSLTAGQDSALYSGEWRTSGGNTVFSLYSIPYGGSPAQILQRKLSAHQAVVAWPAAHNAIVAQATQTPYGWHVDGVSLINPSRTDQSVSIPAEQWPLTVTAQGSTVVLQSGSEVTRVQPDGQVHTTWAAPNPRMLAQMSALLPGWTLFAPGDFSDALTGAWSLASASPGAYTLTRVPTPQNPLELTAQVIQPAPQRPRSLSASAAATPPGGGGNPAGAVSEYFGPWRTDHAFQLSSSEDVMIQWLDASTVNHPAQHAWFASFRNGVWTYEIGPFTSPANRGQTQQLSYLIGRALAQNPTPLAVSGVVEVKMGGATGDFVSTQLRFSTANGASIRLNGSGLEPLNTAGDWTMWTPTHASSK